MTKIAELIRDIPDFPKPGIVFKDITPLLSDPEAFDNVIDAFCDLARLCGVTHVAGIESRGFIFGAPMAARLGVPFVPIRKPGKLPYETRTIEYDLEYGSDALEIHVDAVASGDEVIVVDDLLATGGTAAAACSLVEDLGASVTALLVVIELAFLDGRTKLDGRVTHSLLRY